MSRIQRWKLARLSARRRRKRERRLRRHRPKHGVKRQLTGRGKITIAVPALISLNGPDVHASMVQMLQKLRRAFAGRCNRIIELDFAATELVRPEAMLLLYAELTRLIDAYPERKLSCMPASHDTVDQVLQHVGVYHLLNHKSVVEPKRADVVPWKTVRGGQVEGEAAGKLIESLTQMTKGEHGLLYRSVIEAITNVSQHSNIAEREDGLHLPAARDWWMFCKESEETLYVAICDLGVGIPRSLPMIHTSEIVRAALLKMFGRRRANDAHLIHAALRLKRSRTGQTHRGHGFNDIVGILRSVEGSALRIFSNRGGLFYGFTGPGLLPVIKRQSFKNSILGTILVWSFPLKGIGHEY